MDCTSLRTVSFTRGSKLTEIGCSCFSDSGIHDIVFPSKVRFVGSYAFQNCEKLRRVVLNDGIKEIGHVMFA